MAQIENKVIKVYLCWNHETELRTREGTG